MSHSRPALGLAVLLACSPGPNESSSDDEASSSEGGAFDPDEVVARAMSYATDLERMNAETRASQHGLASTVNIWVAPEIVELYRSLDPDAPGPRVDFPDGALIVKEHLDAAGTPTGYTVMAQGDAASTSGGWWWARIDGDANLQENGAVAFCIDCHSVVEPEGWVFGVPLDNRR